MKKYSEDDNEPLDPSIFTKYVIIVPTHEDKKELLEGFKAIHDSRDLDNRNVVINQLMHEYQPDNNIIVSAKSYLAIKRSDKNLKTIKSKNVEIKD
jgi:hypothetical protein